MESIYWVISRDCNQCCPHCYNDSVPNGPGLSIDQITTCVNHLPDPERVPVHRIILSGGEVLVWPDLLFHSLRELSIRYQEGTEFWIQTNGDLLNDGILERLLAHRVRRIDVASMDRYHPKATRNRRRYLDDLLRAYGFQDVTYDRIGPTCKGGVNGQLRYAFWGANEDESIGPLWPRGRAREKGLSKATPEHRFCSGWSGAKGFLDHLEQGSEVNLQLAEVYPCCPMTFGPIGNLLVEPLIAILDRCREHPVFKALNEGRPEAMGEFLGISEEAGFQRSLELGNHCLWCDEFFSKYAPELLSGPIIRKIGRTNS